MSCMCMSSRNTVCHYTAIHLVQTVLKNMCLPRKIHRISDLQNLYSTPRHKGIKAVRSRPSELKLRYGINMNNWLIFRLSVDVWGRQLLHVMNNCEPSRNKLLIICVNPACPTHVHQNKILRITNPKRLSLVDKRGRLPKWSKHLISAVL